MCKTSSTFLYYFLISLITSFFPEAFYLRVKKKMYTIQWCPLMAPIQKWNFLTCIKCFGKKDVMNETVLSSTTENIKRFQ